MKILTDLRLTLDPKGKAVAHAAVTLDLGEDGQLTIDGFSVLRNDTGFWVAPPARKGEKRYFPVVALTGIVRADVQRAILAEFERQRSEVKSQAAPGPERAHLRRRRHSVLSWGWLAGRTERATSDWKPLDPRRERARWPVVRPRVNFVRACVEGRRSCARGSARGGVRKGLG